MSIFLTRRSVALAPARVHGRGEAGVSGAPTEGEFDRDGWVGSGGVTSL